MTNQEIEVGDVVVLKSGGPQMTATHEMALELEPVVNYLFFSGFTVGKSAKMTATHEMALELESVVNYLFFSGFTVGKSAK